MSGSRARRNPAPSRSRVAAACTADTVDARFERENPFVVREFALAQSDPWIGNAVAYGPHRDRQSPAGAEPSVAELREDLHLIAAHWNLLRVYGTTGPTPQILEVIRADRLDLQVVLGVWIAPVERLDAGGEVVESLPSNEPADQEQLREAVRLAHAYPEIVVAISVGNETQVSWTAHRTALEPLVQAVRTVRAQSSVPTLIQGTPGEREQACSYDEIRAWSAEQRVVTFFFEVFDENSKGRDHPAEVEKHWGLVRADRSAKLALNRSESHDATSQEHTP